MESKKVNRRSLLPISGIALLAAITPASAHADESLESGFAVDPSELPAFAGGRKHGIVSAVEIVPNLGRYEIDFDLDTGRIEIRNPDGSLTHRHAATVAAFFGPGFRRIARSRFV